MKISFRAIMAVAVATGFALPAFADDTPAAATTNKAPTTADSSKKAAPARRGEVQTKGANRPAQAAEAKAAPVFHPEPAVARQANVNIRGQAKLNSEIVGHLKKGDAVVILEEITLKKAAQDEPSRWYRIVLPPAAGAWVHASFVSEGAVKASRLNLRGGPGEEYSILGRIDKGTPIKQLETKGDWLKIEAPTNAYGFVAAHLLDKTPMMIATAPVAPKTNEIAPVPPATETVVAPPTPVVAEPPTTPVTTPPTPPVTTPPVNTQVVPPIEPDVPVEKVKKVVSREGFLKGSVSIQAPTYFELRSLDTGKTIDYVFSPSTNLMLKEFKGKRVIVTGEELLDERWQNTPVIIVDTLQTVP
jgi:uncharacterized protein YgiM (DUF1202 family)